MYMQKQYASMVDRLRPLAYGHLTDAQKSSVDSCVAAGEPYEAMLDLLWVALEHNVPKDLAAEAFNLLDDEDKEEYSALL